MKTLILKISLLSMIAFLVPIALYLQIEDSKKIEPNIEQYEITGIPETVIYTYGLPEELVNRIEIKKRLFYYTDSVFELKSNFENYFFIGKFAIKKDIVYLFLLSFIIITISIVRNLRKLRGGNFEIELSDKILLLAYFNILIWLVSLCIFGDAILDGWEFVMILFLSAILSATSILISIIFYYIKRK